MLTTSDPAVASRLRGFLLRYRELADRAEKLARVASLSGANEIDMPINKLAPDEEIVAEKDGG
jgi:hypothetical protein